MKKTITVADMLELSIQERMKLVEDLWDTIAENPDAVELSEEHQNILNERLAAYEKNPEAGAPWDEVKKRIRGES